MSALDVPPTFLSRSAEAEAIIANLLPGYTPRPAQQRLMRAVETLLDDCRPVRDKDGKVVEEKDPEWLIAEAGTGTGKSLGVLIPAIMSEVARGGRVIVSTSTLALMAQYLRKDLPFLQQVLPVDFEYAALKGLSNFACLQKLSDATPWQVDNLTALREELGDSHETHTGDRDDIVTELNQDQWSLISTTSDECPGRTSCPFGDRCFGVAARDRAAKADVVVTNTKMLFLDVAATMKAKEENLNPNAKDPGSFILGPRTALILDEAHTAADIAADTLGFDLTEGGVRAFIEDATSFVLTHDTTGYPAEFLADRARRSVAAVREVLGAFVERAKEDLEQRTDKPTLTGEFIGEHIEAFTDLHGCIHDLWGWVIRTPIEKGAEEYQSKRKMRLMTTAGNMVRSLKKILLASELGMVSYAEMYMPKKGDGEARWMLRARPIDVGPILREELWSKNTAVLVSATFSTGEGPQGFRFMARTLGLGGARTLNVGTPFDYPRQGMLYYPPSGTPAPVGEKRASWQSWATEASLLLIRAAGGRAMLLYTSVGDMRAAHAAIAPKLEAADGITSYMQGGGMTNAEIAEAFREDETSVLFGTKTFFTGVDFPGPTNELVIISKLPFAVPSEPLYAAKKRRIDAANPNNAWASLDQLAVPMMDLELRQAIGRLIRTTTDIGVVAVLDPRLGNTAYGKRILAALPPFERTTSLADVEAFYKRQRTLSA